ncbi:MAG: hypothetical protein F4018_08165 [Acidobacteria bacterium]|nr:hypothetical protein [Acidobacteriota bacterium]
MDTTPSERPALTTAERTLDTLKYFFEAALDDARMVLRTARAIVRDRQNGDADNSTTGKPKQPAASGQRSTPLTEAQVRDIRRRYRPGETTSALAHEYGRSLKAIGAIARRETWKHLPPEPGKYHQSKTTPSKTPPPASPAETAPLPAAATAPKKRESAAPAAADTNTGTAATTRATRTPAAEPPKKTTPARQAGVHRRGKGRTAAPKLTEAQVREIRRAYRPGGKTKALAKKYGVSATNILKIAQRRSWNHLEPGAGEHTPPPAESDKAAAAAAEPPPPPRRHIRAQTATPDTRAEPTTAPKPNGAARNTARSAPANHAAARVNAEKQRLSPDSIRSIRERAADDVPPRRIARDFGISEETVRALAG